MGITDLWSLAFPIYSKINLNIRSQVPSFCVRLVLLGGFSFAHLSLVTFLRKTAKGNSHVSWEVSTYIRRCKFSALPQN